MLATWIGLRIRLLAPAWFACEVANVLYQRVRRGELALGTAGMALDGVLAEAMLRDAEPGTALRALEAANSLRRSATYDSQSCDDRA